MKKFDPLMNTNHLVLTSMPKFAINLLRENCKIRIDLEKFLAIECKVFSGRYEGAAVRCDLNLDMLDGIDESIYVSIPKYVYSVNSSFFLACFGPSVRRLGEEGFRKKYVFECDTVILKNIDDGISRALKTSMFPTFPMLTVDLSTKKIHVVG